MGIQLKKDFTWSLLVPTSMGVRITPVNGQPVHSSDTFKMQATSAETNVASISSYLGLPVNVITTFVKDSAVAQFIKSNLAARHMAYEGKEINRLICKYGYLTTPEILELVKNNLELRENLSAAAHLIHGSHKNRFKVTYCPGKLTREEIESVNFSYADLDEMMKKYDPTKLKDGFNDVDGEKIFFISNPALGLWAWKNRF